MIKFLQQHLWPISNLIKFLVISFVVGTVLVFLIVSLEKIYKTELEELARIDGREGILDIRVYDLSGHHFSIHSSYFAPQRIPRSRNTRILWFDVRLPELSARKNERVDEIDVSSPDRVSFEISSNSSSNSKHSIDEFVSVTMDAESRTMLPNGWIRYKNNPRPSSEEYTYYKDLNTSTASTMYCNHELTVPNPGCHVTFFLDSELKVNIRFHLSREFDWEEIETKVRTKIKEFKIKPQVD